MLTHVGALSAELPPSLEHLTISFSTAAESRALRWENKNISLAFLTDYFANFYPGDPSTSSAVTAREMAKGVIGFVANELLENALKYNYDRQRAVSISLRLYDDSVIFVLTNSLDPNNVDALQTYLSGLIDGDPVALYMERLEQNALADDVSSSGLGYLTMINDYDATLGWQFDTTPEGTVVMLTTLVRVALRRVS